MAELIVFTCARCGVRDAAPVEIGAAVETPRGILCARCLEELVAASGGAPDRRRPPAR